MYTYNRLPTPNELLNQHDNVLNSFLYITANELGRAVLVASVTIGLGSMASDSKPTLEPAGSLPHISREGHRVNLRVTRYGAITELLASTNQEIGSLPHYCKSPILPTIPD